jgi:hypothetical protein
MEETPSIVKNSRSLRRKPRKSMAAALGSRNNVIPVLEMARDVAIMRLLTKTVRDRVLGVALHSVISR